MLQAYPDLGDCEISADRLKQEGLNGRTWIDLQDPTPAEIAQAVEEDDRGIDFALHAPMLYSSRSLR